MIKKGIILAGGTGSRLAPMTKVTNKHLLPVYNKPMIYFPIDTLKKSGVTELLIITGAESAGDFMKLLGSGRELGVHITFRVQDGSAGIADALKLAENFVGSDNFAVVLGDNIYEESFKTFFDNFRGGAHIFLKEVAFAQRFGVATLNKQNEVVKIIEKPKNPETNFAVTGLYLYDASVFQKLKTLRRSERGEYEITDVNQQYIDEKKMKASFVKEGWSDAGTHESLFFANKLARDIALGGNMKN